MKPQSFRFSLRSFAICLAAVFAATNASSGSSDAKAKQQKPNQKATTSKQQDPQNYNAQQAPISFQSVSKVAEIGGALDVKDVSISEDGKKVFAYVYGGKSIVWEPTKSDGFQIVQCGRVIADLDLCVESKSKGLTVVKASTGDELYKLSADSNDDAIVSPAGTYIAVSSPVDGIVLFDRSNGTQIARLKSTWGFKEVHFSANEALLAANDAAHFAVYDLKRRKEIAVDVTDVNSFAISKTSALLWTTSRFANPQVLTSAGKPVSPKFPDQFLWDYEGSVFGGFMDNESKVVMRTLLGKVGVWDWKSNKFVEIPTKAESIAVAENLVLTVTEQGVTELWDRSAKKLFTFDGSTKLGVMTPDGAHVVTLSKAGSLILWDVHIISSSIPSGDQR
jgi:WD40 repeat protein